MDCHYSTLERGDQAIITSKHYTAQNKTLKYFFVDLTLGMRIRLLETYLSFFDGQILDNHKLDTTDRAMESAGCIE